MKEYGYNGRVACKKPFISEKNQKVRIMLAKEYIYKDKTWWNDVIFTNESKFSIFVSNGHKIVWCKINEELKLKNLKPTIKHDGSSAMVWGCISAAGMDEISFHWTF